MLNSIPHPPFPPQSRLHSAYLSRSLQLTEQELQATVLELKEKMQRMSLELDAGKVQITALQGAKDPGRQEDAVQRLSEQAHAAIEERDAKLAVLRRQLRESGGSALLLWWPGSLQAAQGIRWARALSSATSQQA